MKLIGIDKKDEGHFITRYDFLYRTNDNKEKAYEMISRNKNITSEEDIRAKNPDAVVIIALDESGERILLNKEFRLAVCDWVYNFPAGLIDPGEDAITAAKREVMEETGLELYDIKENIGMSYSAVGFSNETNCCLVARARGEFKPSTSSVEEIEAKWYTKEEVKKLLKTERFAARTQAFCYLWSRIKSEMEI